ncbi:hypothetical protein FRB97_006708 [Tulasnella sp. 331]|nr:hypothetical protein FRB97_006708 [Tulasnella sp. 331]KAG8882285.1 hypothetical protein FRB98_003782 [Tulasnella sp. 332]
MLYSAFFLALAAVPVFSSPLFSSRNLVARGTRYPEGYADRELWKDTIPRIQNYANSIPLAKAQFVLKDMENFMATLTSYVAHDKGVDVKTFDWSRDLNELMSYHGLTENQVNDLATKEEEVLVKLESAKWGELFELMNFIAPATEPQPAEFEAPFTDFLRLTTGTIPHSPTAVDCKVIVDGWKL